MTRLKANRTARADDAVSPVIAVILMVAITVVLAATVYLSVSGFGSQQSRVVTASFASASIDLPSGDGDTTDDSIEITYVSGEADFAGADVEIFVDGLSLTWVSGAGNRVFAQGGDVGQNNEWCGSSPGGANDDDTFERGGFSYLVRTGAAVASTVDLCDGSTTIASLADVTGPHQVKLTVRGQALLEATPQVHDSAAS